jgi:TonB family protein
MYLLLAFLSLPVAAQAPEPVPEELPPLLKNPELLNFVQAPYPPEAQAQGLEGTVLLELEIDAAGKVVAVRVLRSAGVEAFDRGALEAAAQFVFSPAEDATGPVPVIIEFEYGFVLDAASRPDAVPETSEEPPVPAVEAPINLEGTLLEMGTRRILADILVQVTGKNPDGSEFIAETTTDSEGHFAFRGVPLGDASLKVVHPGFATTTETAPITEGQITELKLYLRNLSYGSAGVIGSYQKEKTEVTQRTLSMEVVRRIPGTFGDPIRVIQNLPGAARSPFGTGLLIIRGSNPEDSGVYVDGIRIPFIYHIGGFESVINPDLVASVDYLPGGFGVQYGRSMGGTVDVTTKNEFGEQPHLSWSTDILDSGGMFTMSLGEQHQHGIGIAARRSYIDLILPFFMRNSGFVAKPRWYDYQIKYQYQGDAPYKLSALVFGFQDILIASTPEGFAQGTDQDTQGDLGTTYSTHRAMLNLEYPLSPTLDFRFIPAFGNDYGEFSLGNEWSAINSQWLFELRSELSWKPSEHFELVPGVDFLAGWSDFEIRLPFDPAQFAETDPFAEREPFGVDDTQPGWGPDPYIFARIRPLKNPDTLLLVPGFRMSYVNIPGELATIGYDPRFSFRVAPVPTSRIKGSVGLYTQPPQPFQAYRHDETPIELTTQKTLSTTLGFEQDVGQAWHGEIEFFYKNMFDLIVDNPEFTSLDDQFFVNEGVGRSYGMELMIRHDPIGKFFGWISYTLSRSERLDHPGEEWYYFDYDQPHILTGVAGYKLPFDIEFSGKAQYVSGNPETIYNLGIYDIDQDFYQPFSTTLHNSTRLPPYWSVSVRIDKLFTFKTWQLDLYLDLLNALHGVNPEFRVYNYDYTESDFVRGLPIIPSPGFEIKANF